MWVTILVQNWLRNLLLFGLTFIAYPVWGVIFIESQNISFSEVEIKATFELMNFRTRYLAAQTPEKVSEVLVNTFRQALIAKEAERVGLASELVVSARLEQVRQAELVRIILERKRKELNAKLPDFSKQAQEIYQANPEEFSLPEQVDVGHILFRNKSCETADGLRAKAQVVRERLQKGESFEDLARELSEDKDSASNGGRLGLQQRDTFVPVFGDAAFALQEPGQISEIIETKSGFHVLKLYARQPASKQLFEDVKPGIVQRLEKDYVQREIDYWRQSLWDANPPRIDKNAIEAFTKELQNSFPKLDIPGN